MGCLCCVPREVAGLGLGLPFRALLSKGSCLGPYLPLTPALLFLQLASALLEKGDRGHRGPHRPTAPRAQERIAQKWSDAQREKQDSGEEGLAAPAWGGTILAPVAPPPPLFWCWPGGWAPYSPHLSALAGQDPSGLFIEFLAWRNK